MSEKDRRLSRLVPPIHPGKIYRCIPSHLRRS
jgi:hypothetical protein